MGKLQHKCLRRRPPLPFFFKTKVPAYDLRVNETWDKRADACKTHLLAEVFFGHSSFASKSLFMKVQGFERRRNGCQIAISMMLCVQFGRVLAITF